MLQPPPSKPLQRSDKGPPSRSAGLFGLSCPYEQAALAIIPVCWDATVSYGKGASTAPAGIVRASHQLDLEDLAFAAPFRPGIFMHEPPGDISSWNSQAAKLVEEARRLEEKGASPAIKAAVLEQVNHYSQKLNERVYSQAKAALQDKKLVALLGGDHSSPFGLVKALAEEHEQFAILHFDAHMDLRQAYEGFEHSHASIMYNILEQIPQVTKLVQVGIRDFCKSEAEVAKSQGQRVSVFWDRDLYRHQAQGHAFAKLTEQILAKLPEKVYVSFDIDGLKPAYCPSTGTPVPGGLAFHEALYVLEELAFSGRTIIGFDLCEVVDPGGGKEWDLNVGARVLYKLCGALLHSQGLLAT